MDGESQVTQPLGSNVAGLSHFLEAGVTINVHTTNVAETRHQAHLDEKQLHALIAQAVAEQAGVDLGAENVRVERVWISSNSGSINRGAEYSAEVTLVVDHRPRQEAA